MDQSPQVSTNVTKLYCVAHKLGKMKFVVKYWAMKQKKALQEFIDIDKEIEALNDPSRRRSKPSKKATLDLVNR